MSALRTLFKYAGRVILVHIAVNTTPITCMCAMYPLCVLTDVYPLDEGGGFSRNGTNGKRVTDPQTPFETIVSTMGGWPWGLMGLILPLPPAYLWNLSIIAFTIVAYPSAVHHLVTKRS